MANGRRVSGSPGTGFTGLDDWARANATGAQSLADRLAGGVESEGQAAQQGLDALGSDFYRRMTGGAVRYYPGVDSGTAAAFGQRGYNGPDGLSDLEGYGSVMGAADRAGQNARRLGDVYGRATALQDMAGNRDYSNGQQLLDSALAGRAGGSRFAQLGQQWGGLFGRAQGLERTAADRASQTRQSSNEAAQRYAADAPVLARQEEQTRQDQNNAYIDHVNRDQDVYDRAHPETTGEDNRHLPRNRARDSGNKNALTGWGKGGSWA